MTPLADLARAMYGAAVAAVQPATLMRRLDFAPAGVSFAGAAMAPAGRLVLVALGKAAPGSAATFLRRSERAPDTVFALAPDGVPVPEDVAAHCRHASHPVPDARGDCGIVPAVELERQRDVLRDVEIGQHMEGLEYKSQRLAPP